MKLYRFKKYLLIALILLGVTQVVNAQDGAGTTSLHNGLYIGSGATWTDVAETMYLGPGSYTIEGTWNIYSKNIWIHPDATISGDGKMVFQNPSANPNYPDMTGATTIDHNNGVLIEVSILHQNPNNIILGDIADPGYGSINPTGSLAAKWNVKKFAFEIDGGDVILNGNDFDVVGSGTGVLTGYSQNRMVVTGNSIVGHFIRSSNSNNDTIVFPIGIAEGDYTPFYATGSSSSFYVSVVNYLSVDAPTITPANEGMDRIWHFGINGANPQTIELHHNSGVGGTNGVAYVDTEAFIAYYHSDTWNKNPNDTERLSAGVHKSSSLVNIPRNGSVPIEYLWLTKISPDTEDPVISNCPTDITVYRASGASNTIVTWTPPTATDNRTVTLTSTHNSGAAFVLGETKVTYTAVDGAGNKATCSFNVIVVDEPSATTSQTNVSCNGDSNGTASVVPSGGTGGYTYSWAPSGGNGATATGLAAGTYTVTITDANNYSITRSVTITEPTMLNLPAYAGQTAVSMGTAITYSFVATGGNSGFTYAYTGNLPTGLTLSASGELSGTTTAAGDYTFNVTVTDSKGCVESRTVNIKVADPLPVSLTNFVAKAVSSGVEVSWTTVSESNSSHFELRHAADNGQFKAIASIEALGNSSAGKRYSYLHRNAVNGNNYYQLIQVDRNNDTHDYGVKEARFETVAKETVFIFPNPATHTLTISFPANTYAKLQLVDAVGKILSTKKIGAKDHELKLEVNHLPVGLYTIMLSSGNHQTAHKFIKQ